MIPAEPPARARFICTCGLCLMCPGTLLIMAELILLRQPHFSPPMTGRELLEKLKADIEAGERSTA